MLFRIIVWGFIIVMIFRFITRFLFPVVKVTKTMQDRLRQMQSQMDEMQNPKQQAPTPKPNRVKEGDYIDYEEVKDR